MNFIHNNDNNNNEYNVLRSSCTTVSNEDNDGIYSDETESMINHARSSPMNDSIDTIANTIRITPPTPPSTAITPTTTPPLTSKSNTDDDDDDHSERHVNHNNDTNSHTTIDEDLMTSYEASIDIEYNNNHYELHNELMHKSFPINSLNSMKKPEKQVTFQDIVEISTIYSITNESQESISHHYEDGDDDEEEDDYNDDDDDDEEEEEMKMTKQNSVNKKLKNRLKNVIKSNDHNVGLVIATIEQNNINNSDSNNNNNNQILSEKDLLSVSDRLELFYFIF
ncbi:uncharacterized protein DC041_0011932 [Schistosoma bovis]|uniref:Uncharacterized protein n=1 Tax=Schistosoma bovis TaxID=6184 RepID=A0A430QTR4_SCHBO|nr:uncharacterized protein DC041_0011932 [Schistosoma bovis]